MRMLDVLHVACTFDGDMARADRRLVEKTLSMELDRNSRRASVPDCGAQC